MLSQSLPTFTGSLSEVTELPVSRSLGPFSALCWLPSPARTAQQSGPAPWEFSLGSPLPADTAALGPSLSLFPPAPAAHLLGQASLAEAHTLAVLSHLRAPLPRQQHLGVPPWRHHSARQEWATPCGSRGETKQEGEQIPRLPAWGAALLLQGSTPCALGGCPTSAGPEHPAVSTDHWP